MNSETYSQKLIDSLNHLDHNTLQEIVNTMETFVGKNTVFIAGNGGNSANALHMATDLSKGLFLARGKPINAIALHENSALFSAVVNDIPDENYFSFLLEMSATSSDLLVAYTAGGTSRNVLKAAEKAKSLGLKTIGLTGCKGGSLGGLFDIHLHVDSMNIQIVEDIHGIIGHVIYSGLTGNES
jgi:D-sedoheptulose 7-phosphate isomerase